MASEVMRKDHRIYLKVIEGKINKDEECDSYVVIKINGDVVQAKDSGGGIVTGSNLTVDRSSTMTRNRKLSAVPKGQDVIKSVTTKTVLKSKSPWFDEEFELELDDRFREIAVELWTKSLIKDKLLGQIIIPYIGLDQDGKAHENWFTLQQLSIEQDPDDKKANKAHEFQLVKLTAPRSCEKCRGILWGINHTAMQCTQCNATCHPKCASSLPATCGIVGTMRIKYLYTDEFILPLPTYAAMLELVLDEKFNIAMSLGRVTEEREDVAKTLVLIAEHAGQAVRFLNTIAEAEIKSTSNANTIFRHNSLGSKAIDQYMKLIGMKYLKSVLQPVIQEILIQNRPCELDPTRLEKTDNVEENFTVLEAYIKWAIDRILNSAPNCPIQLRRVFAHLRIVAAGSFPTDPVVSYTVVTAFVFLRFFNAAILGPQLFGLSPDGEPPNPRNARTLTLISKTVQQLANMTPFDGKKEPYMAQLNHLVQNNINRMKRFVDEITIPPTEAEIASVSKKKEGGFAKGLAKFFTWKSDKKENKDVDIERYLASLHRHLMRTQEKMVAAQKDDEKADHEKLQTVLADMMEIYNKKSREVGLEREALLKRFEQDNDASSIHSGTIDRSHNSLSVPNSLQRQKSNSSIPQPPRIGTPTTAAEVKPEGEGHAR